MADATALDWQAQALQQALQDLVPGLRVQVQASVGSTNTELLERLRHAPDSPPCLLVAEQQTAGRGRQGKVWWSQAGASLTFSLAVPMAPQDWSGLSLAVGLALADALDPAPRGEPARLGIKWPNDLLLRGDDPALPGHKLGGILIETVGGTDRRWAVVGVGLNVLPRPASLAPAQALPWGHAHLQTLLPGMDAAQALARIAVPLLQALLDFEQAGFAPLGTAFARRDLLAGRWLRTQAAGDEAPLQGQADGVDEQGVLWLRNADGRHPVRSGELGLQPPGSAAEPAPGRADAAPC